MIDRFCVAHIPELGWFELEQGDPIALSLAELSKAVPAETSLTAKLMFQVVTDADPV